MDKAEYKHQWYEKNKERIKANAKIRYYSNHEEMLKQRHEYWLKNKDKERKSGRERQKQKYETNPEWKNKHLENYRDWYHSLPKDEKDKLLKKNRERNQKNYQKYKIAKTKWDRDTHTKTKHDVMQLCGNNKIACIICGIEDIDVLTIDHINGRNGEARKTRDKKKAHYGIRLWLKILKGELNKSEFQTLCMNCNWKRHLQSIKKQS